MRTFLHTVFFIFSLVQVLSAQAPDFTCTDSGGKTHHLYADYVQQGKVVVLEIFFINCPPCATHAPHVQNLYQQIKTQYGDRVEFILFSDKGADTNPFVAQYRTDKALTMPAVGSDGGSLTAVQPYKSGQFGPYYGTPTFVVIEPNTGQVHYDIRGNNAAGTMSLISQKIADLLPVCQIKTPQGDTLENYRLTLTPPGGGTAMSHQITDGAYTLENFPGLPALPFFDAVPAKNDNYLNGVSTFDLVLINRQILGLEPFQHAWQFVAADANNSTTVSTIDIVEFRKLILGIYDTLPQVPSWVFSPAKDTIWPHQCPEFTAIKKGDVNGNALANNLLVADDREDAPWPISVENQYVKAGQTLMVRLRSDQRGAWAGFQVAFRFDGSALQILGVQSDVLPGLDENAWNKTNGRLALSWLAPGSYIEVDEHAVFLEIELLALRDGPLSAYFFPEEMPLRSEAYAADGSRRPLEWNLAPVRIISAVLAPNPATDHFAILLERKKPETTPLQLVDLQGKIVFEKMLELCPGSNRCEIVPGALATGMYTVRVAGQVIGKLVWSE